MATLTPYSVAGVGNTVDLTNLVNYLVQQGSTPTLMGLTITGALSVTGIANFAQGSVTAPSITAAAEPGTGFFFLAGGVIRWTGLGVVGGQFYNTGALVGFDILNDAAQFRLGAGTDVVLTRDAADTLAQKRGVNAQIARLYKTTTGPAYLQFDTTGGLVVTVGYALTNNAAAQAATITNGPAAGNPTKWIPINDNGTIRNIPAW